MVPLHVNRFLTDAVQRWIGWGALSLCCVFRKVKMSIDQKWVSLANNRSISIMSRSWIHRIFLYLSKVLDSEESWFWMILLIGTKLKHPIMDSDRVSNMFDPSPWLMKTQRGIWGTSPIPSDFVTETQRRKSNLGHWHCQTYQYIYCWMCSVIRWIEVDDIGCHVWFSLRYCSASKCHHSRWVFRELMNIFYWTWTLKTWQHLRMSLAPSEAQRNVLARASDVFLAEILGERGLGRPHKPYLMYSMDMRKHEAQWVYRHTPFSTPVSGNRNGNPWTLSKKVEGEEQTHRNCSYGLTWHGGHLKISVKTLKFDHVSFING